MKRDTAALAEGRFDLLLLGGGITGAGVALDAATRGLRVALIDKGDFASGTSSISSKLVHGGLRYLEQGDFRLVREALRERAHLLRNAPHLVRPLRFVLPLYQAARVPPWKWRLGLLVYDVLAGRGNIRRSRLLPLRRIEHEFPELHRRGLLGGLEYHDAQMDDARLCIEVLRTAAIHGATVANYVEAVSFERQGDRIAGVQVRDHLYGEEFSIAARVVVNATGPWGDRIRHLAGDDSSPLLRPTKGVHLVAPNRGLRAAFLFLHPADGRVFFVIPWMNKTLIGTTDTVCDEPPDEVRTTAADEAYLLEGFNHYLDPPLRSTDLLSRFAGLRPLIGERPGAPSDLSREFELVRGPGGLLTVAGGKYTTYRHMAEVITSVVADRLGLRARCRTADLALDGTPAEPWPHYLPAAIADLAQEFGIGQPTAAHLVERYGRRAAEVAELTRGNPVFWRLVIPEEPEIQAEFVYHWRHEMAYTAEDFLLRRTRLGLFRPELLQNPPVQARAAEESVAAGLRGP
jgi:glycerol-3-phosphate dehydrogenase